jgi:3-dehydroquinate synthase
MQGDIYIGKDVLERRLSYLTGGQKNIVLVDENVYRIHGALLKRYFRDEEFFVVESGEKNKELTMVATILKEMLERGLTRASRLFAVGGGVIGDMGGLIASLYMRGISYVQIPTTLLAQIDSSVGGKTAVDVCGIKNLVGAFYQPCEVLVNPAFLNTLPAREIKCGLGEMVKYAALCGEIFDVLSSDIYRLGNLSYLTGFIADCIRYKAKVVGEDEKETGIRRCLNLGHTTGHAIESACGLSHGECVLYGLYLETKVAIEKGVCEKDYGEKLLNLVCGSLAVEPRSTLFHHVLEEGLEKALLDKKNKDDGCVALAVAKAKGEWTTLSLEFEEYRNAIINVVKF